MAATVHEYGWATPEGWEEHREIITNLYFYQNKKLRELKVIMEQEYHFFATDKMYKSHFKKWNVKKNCKHEGSKHASSSSSSQSKSKSDKSSKQSDQSGQYSGNASGYA